MKQKEKRRLFHLKRTGLFGILLVAFFIVRFDAGSLPGPLHSKVLSYATEMSLSGLLSGTNAARASQGLGALTLDIQLNNAAQMKAQDMASKDYWAHVAPDGTQPWYFFDQAGYTYLRAGENLAYGFSTSQGTVDGWMNSPSHRANILGDYRDVGFGIVNAPSYQGSGQQTIVVAHYGTKANSTPPPAPAPTPIAPTAPTPTPPAPPAEVAEPTPLTPTDTQTPPAENKPSQDPTASPTAAENPVEPAAVAPVQTGEESQVSVLSMIANRNLPLAAIISLAMVSFAVAGYALTHRAAFVHAVIAGEHFVIRHPGIDTAVMAALTSLILLTTYGTLQ